MLIIVVCSWDDVEDMVEVEDWGVVQKEVGEGRESDDEVERRWWQPGRNSGLEPPRNWPRDKGDNAQVTHAAHTTHHGAARQTLAELPWRAVVC